MILDILLTLFLVLLNGFFVAAEFAIVKVRSSQIELKVTQGNRVAGMARHMLGHLDSYLSATQLGITLASLGLGWIGEGVVSNIIIKLFNLFNAQISHDTAHDIALPVSFALITVLHIVFGELAPKSLAIRYPLRVTLGVSAPMRFFYIVFRPFIWILNGLANGILGIMGIKPVHEQDSHTEEEIRIIIGESRESGYIRDSEHQLIENVFKFDESTVRKIMIPRTRVSAVDIESTKDEVLQIVISEGFSRLPVYRNSIDQIVGILYARDVFSHINDPGFNLEAIIRPPYFIPESKKISDLLRDFQKKKLHMAVVADEFGGTSGIVTMEDVLEELVGEIQDETDDEVAPVQVISDKEWVVDASLHLDELNTHLPENLPLNEDYETLSGFIFFVMKRIPDAREKLSYENYEMEVLSKVKNNIQKVKIRFHGELE